MNEIEYFIFIPVKKFVSVTAKLLRYLVPAILLCGIAEIALLYGGFKEGMHLGIISDQLLEVFISFLSLIALWCHHVLLARRGYAITRFLMSFSAVMSGIFMICMVYTLATGEFLLVKQHQTPILVACIIMMAVLCNLNNMAAASRMFRFGLVVFVVALLGAGITAGVLIPISLLFKIVMAVPAYIFLKKLEQVAPRIISMPELS